MLKGVDYLNLASSDKFFCWSEKPSHHSWRPAAQSPSSWLYPLHTYISYSSASSETFSVSFPEPTKKKMASVYGLR